MSDDQVIQLFKKVDDIMSNMATKDDITDLRNEMNTGFDRVITRAESKN